MKVESVRARWIAALNQGSTEEFVRCVTVDAVWLPPRGEAVQGHEALTGWLRPLFKQFRYEFAVENVEVRYVGDWAVEEADFLSTLHPAQTGEVKPLTHRGRYLLIWRRSEKGWLIDRYVDRTAAREVGQT